LHSHGLRIGRGRLALPRSEAQEHPQHARLAVLGLRPRLLGALMLTSVVTVLVAALALLPPLEHRLRADGEASVFTAINVSSSEFKDMDVGRRTGLPNPIQLAAATRQLSKRTGGQVTVLDGQLHAVLSGAPNDFNIPVYYEPASRALRSGRLAHTVHGEELVAAEPVQIGKRRYVLVVDRRLEYVDAAVDAVQHVFIESAGAGLAIALVLGVALTTTMLRRLRRLRDAARQLELRGVGAEPPVDSGRDEIGELARSFAAMHARLRLQEESRRAFVATASHELRTPLASLDAMLELLSEDLDEGRLDLQDARRRTSLAREQSRRLSGLATDLLDLSRLDAQVEMRTEPLELGELCRAVSAEFEILAAERGVRIEMHHAEEPCWVAGDPGAVARIVRILLDNALRVAPTSSAVTIDVSSCGPAGEWGELVVADHGPGVPPAERNAIFERFQRGSATGGQGGFGLGLAIGSELAARMNGALELLPPQGRGARFRLRMPAAREEQTA
jgi:signal transduction histidine kinase